MSKKEILAKLGEVLKETNEMTTAEGVSYVLNKLSRRKRMKKTAKKAVKKTVKSKKIATRKTKRA